jgi:hypothetical protein
MPLEIVAKSGLFILFLGCIVAIYNFSLDAKTLHAFYSAFILPLQPRARMARWKPLAVLWKGPSCVDFIIASKAGAT